MTLVSMIPDRQELTILVKGVITMNSNNNVVIWEQMSTNNRHGLALVGPESTTLPAEGSVTYLGEVGGIITYLLTPGETNTWVTVMGDITVHGGATVVCKKDLQSFSYGSIVLMGPYSVIEHHNYRRRGSTIHAYVKGVKMDIPAPVLLAMGLIATNEVAFQVEPPPPLTGAIAAAFAALKK